MMWPLNKRHLHSTHRTTGKKTSPEESWLTFPGHWHHLVLLWCCKNCTLLHETVVEARKRNGDSWKITARHYYGATNVFLAYNLIKSISTLFLKSLKQIYISAVFTICLVICVYACVCANVYFYFRMFCNKTALVHGTLSKHRTSLLFSPFQACY